MSTATVGSLRDLRSMLMERLVSSNTELANLYGRMIAVMDNHSKRGLPVRRKPNIRELHRHVSLTIDELYGVRTTPRRP